jgi:hypothetical protein
MMNQLTEKKHGSMVNSEQLPANLTIKQAADVAPMNMKQQRNESLGSVISDNQWASPTTKTASLRRVFQTIRSLTCRTRSRKSANYSPSVNQEAELTQKESEQGIPDRVIVITSPSKETALVSTKKIK